MDGSLDQSVDFNVFREIVVPYFYRVRAPIPASDLLLKPDATAHGRLGGFHRAISLQDPRPQSPINLVDEPRNYCLNE